MADGDDPQKPLHPHLIPAMILCVGLVSATFLIVSTILYRQIDAAAKGFSIATNRMDGLFKDSGATATNVQLLRDDFKSIRQDINNLKKDFRDDLKNIRDDGATLLDEIKRLRDTQNIRDVTWHEMKNDISKLTISSNDTRRNVSDLREEIRLTRSYEIQFVESYGVKVDEQLLVKFQNGIVTVSPLTAQKTQQIQQANFVQLTSGSSGRTWWSPPRPIEFTSTVHRPAAQRSKSLQPRP